jgi:pimeloyl-ACP methyl ester carboxylesterase
MGNPLNSWEPKVNLLGDPASRPVQVIVPPGYHTSNRRYPVVYFLHGFCGNPHVPILDKLRGFYLAGDFDGPTGDLVADVGRGVQLGETEAMILVFLNAGNSLGGSWYRSSSTIGDYETYLVKELVDCVDSHYRSLPQLGGRSIAGCSRGGYGAAHLGLTHPDVYGVVVAQSAPHYLDREPSFLASERFTHEPADSGEFLLLPIDTRAHIAVVAAVAPDSNKPPFYLDMPYVVVGSKTEIAPGYAEKLRAFDWWVRAQDSNNVKCALLPGRSVSPATAQAIRGRRYGRSQRQATPTAQRDST